MKRQLAVSDFLKPLDEAPIQAYLSNALQVADIMEWIIGQIGECDIIQSSFSVSEEYLRRLYFMKAREQVRSITLLLDLKATNMTVKLWVFISQLVKNTFLADNHSKILLFRAADGRRVSVITSQNLTRGNRNESTVVTTCPQIYKSLSSSLQDIIRNNSVPLTEIMDNAMNFTPPHIS